MIGAADRRLAAKWLRFAARMVAQHGAAAEGFLLFAVEQVNHGYVPGGEIPRVLGTRWGDHWRTLESHVAKSRGDADRLYLREVRKALGNSNLPTQDEIAAIADQFNDTLWPVWQVKKHKALALQAAAMRAREEGFDLAEVAEFVKELNEHDDQWSKGIGIPHLHRWLTQRRDETDEITTARADAGTRADREAEEAWR